jgi:hypothetical protein
MNQCLRCNRQCSATSLFCDACESLFQGQERLAPGDTPRVENDVSALATSPHVTLSPPVQGKKSALDADDDIAKRITAPNPGVRASDISEPLSYSVQTNRVEQALHRLSDAARRLAATEPDNQHKPKISRLSPIRDISEDIQRHSTPLPAMHEHKLFSIDDEQSDDLGGNLPDLWPWLNDGDSGEIEAESWSNRTDPLISRRFPDSTEAALIEQEDMRRADAEGLPTFTLRVPRKHASRLRVVFASLTILAILALTIDSILVSVAFLNNNHNNKKPVSSIPPGPPTLILSNTEVVYGQAITLHIRNFSASSLVYVTRDMDVPVGLKAPSIVHDSYIRVDSKGSADVSMSIEATWDPGFHTINAEDQVTRHTAQTTLHIGHAGPTRPPHLVVDTLTIDLGDAAIGANSVRPLSMHNDGSSSITWSASSDQSWLLVAPNEGTFSDNQTISVAGQRANLKAGDYSGTITISSSVGISAQVPVVMTVDPLPTIGTPVLQITPALLSFVAVDGSAAPNPLPLLVSNLGKKPLHWSISSQSSTTDGSGSFALTSGLITNWLKTNLTQGTIAPNATTTLQVSALSSSLLPGAYTSTLVFNADKGTVNTPQSVNVSLTIEPRCSLQVSTNALTFTTIVNSSPATQAISLSASASCPATSAWNATTTQHWLSVTPSGSQLKGIANSTATVAINTSNLAVGTYNDTITLTLAQTQNTQSVAVQLTVQPLPSPSTPSAPSMTVSPLNLNFNMMQGSGISPPQIISITNTGGSPLNWYQTATYLPGVGNSAWMGAFPLGSSTPLGPGQTAQITVRVRTVLPSKVILGAGMYPALITIAATDGNSNQIAGSPQVVSVNLNVVVPCTLPPPTASTLAFTAVQGGSEPAPQTETFGASGNCAWPATWSVTGSLPSWLNTSSTTGSFTTDGQSAAVTVSPTIAGLSPGTYTAQMAIAATDTSGTAAAQSPQSITVNLTITGFTVAGVVNACADTLCSTPTPLANATLTLTDGSGTQFTAIADANGNYSFANVALGSCTISVSGSNGTTTYSGNTTLNVTGDQPAVNINAF